MKSSAGLRRRSRESWSVLALSLLSACSGPGPTALNVGEQTNGGSVSVVVGDSLNIILGTVGPGHYLSPPLISGPAVAFLRDDVVPPFDPGGPTQRFQFRAAARGIARITLSRTDAAGVVDTAAYVLEVVVR